jgi:hybrid cluster-associated redox disulfide protein
MARVNKDTTIGEVIQIDAGVIPILMGAGMHCVGCPSSAGETLEEAAMVHGIDGDMLVEEIQSYLYCSYRTISLLCYDYLSNTF